MRVNSRVAGTENLGLVTALHKLQRFESRVVGTVHLGLVAALHKLQRFEHFPAKPGYRRRTRSAAERCGRTIPKQSPNATCGSRNAVAAALQQVKRSCSAIQPKTAGKEANAQ